MAVTPEPPMDQCAEMQMTPFGSPIYLPRSRHVVVMRFSSITFPGLPCPKKIAGMRGVSTSLIH
jgi:hypothetical protein